jgi:predicted Zn-dependent protease
MKTCALKTTKRLLTVLFALLALTALAPAQQPVPTDDPLLNALRAELKRAQEIQLPGQKKPYFVQYIVNDADSFGYESSLGAPLNKVRTRTRFITVFVRVGDYAHDNDLGFGMGEYDIISVDDDVVALRRALWLATDRAYKNALQMLTAKESMLKEFESTDDVPSLSRETAVQYFEPRIAVPADTERLERALDAATALYRTDPQLQTLAGSLRLTVNNYYLVNTEGTLMRLAQPGDSVVVHAETQAPDGMRLRRTYSLETRSLEDLPSADQLKTEAAELIKTLKALRAAPAVASEYRGPVLFSNDAAGTVLESLIAKALVATRPPPGKSGRVVGPYGESYRSRVLPDSVTIVDDPTIATLNGQPLVGSTKYDDEGVKTRPVTLVEKGVLQNYLLSRRPVKDFITSNGHGRNLGPTVMPSPMNLILSSSKGEPFATLKQKLIDMCKERGLDYGYYVGTLGGVENPRLLYRVYVKDGREELVRGGVLDELDTRTLRNDIIAIGNDPLVTNNPANLPASYVAPSILFGELVVKSTTEAKEKLPLYPPPAL